MSSNLLPITGLRREFERQVLLSPVVLSSPTGSGKSTQVPRWCAEAGRVLVVEPRRVACRSLAQRVSQLEGSELGRRIGYHVRDERRAGDATRVLFATPGMVLRWFDRIDRFQTVIVDEFHERQLDVDLLLALLLQRRRQGRFSGGLVVMSATLDGDRLAKHMEGVHLHAEGRTYPVDIRYLAGKTLLPDVQGLEARLVAAVDAAAECDGDMLVFLPGKGEIAAASKALARRRDLEILPLHGGLSLREQSRVFSPSDRRRVILATNVAETSLTVPGVGVVIDSGLVRQTRYVRDRGFLTLVPVAMDSADQRAGRAGRTAPGVCFRLWSEAAKPAPRTPPEVHRESLVPLVLAASAHGERCADLPFADPPKEHALATARRELEALGAWRADGITERGRRLFGLPLDPQLGRWLVEAEQRQAAEPGVVADMVDLVAALSVERGLVLPPSADDLENNPSIACDGVASIQALRGELPNRLRRSSMDAARTMRGRLVTAFGLEVDAKTPAETTEIESGTSVNRDRLIRCLLAADPRLAHIPRRRGKRTGWSNGGTELELGRDCGANGLESVEALLVLATAALSPNRRDARLVITAAMPVRLAQLAEAGLGRARVVAPALDQGRVRAVVEQVYAKKVLSQEERVPEGVAAREAIAELFLAGRLFPEALKAGRDDLEAVALAHRLVAREANPPYWLTAVIDRFPEPPPPFERWLEQRLEELGVESGDDLELLSPADLTFPPLPEASREELNRSFPRRLKVQGVLYGLTYDLEKNRVTLRAIQGKPQKPPERFYLPRFSGLRVQVEYKGVLRGVV